MRRGLALVTGASRGIGRACAESLAGAGYAVACIGRDGFTLQAVVDALPLPEAAAAGGLLPPIPAAGR